MRLTLSHVALLGAFVSLAALTAYQADARGGRGGGGARGAGASSMSHGGGGGSGFSRGGSYSRPSGGASAAQRPSGSTNRTAAAGQRPTQQPSGGNRNTVNGGNTNISGGNNINTGNINTGDINVNRNVHVDNDLPHGYYGGWHDYPIARGAVIGAVAVTTAVAIGSAYYALPPACAPYPWKTYTYYYCGSVYYRPQYQGDTIVYVTVAKPS